MAAEPTAAAVARSFVRHALRTWSLDRLGDDAELIVSELVANAVKATNIANSVLAAGDTASPAPVVIELQIHDDALRIAVEDSSTERPTLQGVDQDAEGGRGLFLVQALSARWDAFPVVGGKVTWAELALTPDLDS